jgi:hypothetical protein
MAERRCSRKSTQNGHHQEVFLELVRKVVHGALDELAAVVGGDDFHPLRQAFLQRGQLFAHGGDDRAGVFARTQQHNAAGHLALAVELHQAPAHFRAQADGRHLLQVDGRAVGRGLSTILRKSTRLFR